MKKILKVLKNFFLVNESIYDIKYLNEATDIFDLERRQRVLATKQPISFTEFKRCRF